MKKQAVSNEEDAVRVKAMLVSRTMSVDELNVLFQNAKKARAKDVKKMEKLLIQAPAAQTQQPTLQKEAAAMLAAHESSANQVIGGRVLEFFEKRAYLTDAQKRFPELLKVGATSTAPQKPPQKTLPTQTPARSLLAGGQA